MKKNILLTPIIFLFLTGCTAPPAELQAPAPESNPASQNTDLNQIQDGENENAEQIPAMAIDRLRQGVYPGGEFEIKEELNNGSNFRRFIASYKSEGLTINGLLTIPLAEKPENGFPAIMFIHGYIPPTIYSTVNSYPTYQNYLARSGYITYKPDLRGHDESEGEPVSAHYSEKYVIDTLNALSYLKKHPDVNAERIGYWGHSNGGEIGLRTILVDQDIKAASFWAGVVGSYEDMFETYVEQIPFLEQDNPLTSLWGLPSGDNKNWDVIEPYNFLDQITIPIELQHGTADDSVPVELSRELYADLQNANVEATLIEYPGDDHNIGQNTSQAWQTTIKFFNEKLR